VVIATVFLTIIGMTAGYVLGERHRRSDSSGRSPTTGSDVSTTASAVPTIAVGGPPCPEAAQQAALAAGGGQDLRQILKITTDNKTTVWICEDQQRNLYYQSHTLTKGQDLPLRQNSNGLFLPRVTRKGDGFEVVDQSGNRFEVGRERLQIYFATGKVESDDVDTVEG
jgi:hypothetical protein